MLSNFDTTFQTIILWAMHFVPGLRLRASEQAEILGIDDADMGEFAYDYVGLEQEIGHSVEAGVTRETDQHRTSNPSVDEKA